ncbi:hypothetical protein [Shewanella surugensis]|uniref:Uncharacterized protein n=1 Tax=Shewanella surugensis TaxID=212020 RepID=A0ABT0LH81_9GAMM|nr:hypothetical protein [Shewanella surugensis]MCL1126516.1 hypothetical protein [Shewanella surugensis]
MTVNLATISQLHNHNLSEFTANDTIKLNGQRYKVTIADSILVSKDYGNANCAQKLGRNITDFFERLTTSDQKTDVPRAAQMQNILQGKLSQQQEKLQLEQNQQQNQSLNIANINTSRAFLNALTEYKGNISLEDAVAFKQAYRNIQLSHKGDSEIYGVALVSKAFNSGLFSEQQYQRLCELTQVASTHGKLSHELNDATQLSQTDFLSLQSLAADSRAIQTVAQQHDQDPQSLINKIRHFETRHQQSTFDKSDIGKQIIAESRLLKKTNEKICNELAWEAIEKR